MSETSRLLQWSFCNRPLLAIFCFNMFLAETDSPIDMVCCLFIINCAVGLHKSWKYFWENRNKTENVRRGKSFISKWCGLAMAANSYLLLCSMMQISGDGLHSIVNLTWRSSSSLSNSTNLGLVLPRLLTSKSSNVKLEDVNKKHNNRYIHVFQ